MGYLALFLYITGSVKMYMHLMDTDEITFKEKAVFVVGWPIITPIAAVYFLYEYWFILR